MIDMTPTNKLLPTTAVTVLVGSLLAMFTYYAYKGSASWDSVLQAYFIAIPFILGLYTATLKPGLAQLSFSLLMVVKDLALKKLSIVEAMAQVEILIKNAVTLWNDLNNTKVPATNPPSEAAKA